MVLVNSLLRLGILIIELTIVLLIGILGGTTLGFVILSLLGLLGFSGTTGTEYVGYWQPQYTFFDAIVYGSFFGVIGAMIGYFMYLRNSPVLQTHWILLLQYTVVVTLVCGILGGLLHPFVGAVLGILGFVISTRSLAKKLN